MTLQQSLRSRNRNLYENIHQWLRRNFKKSGVCTKCKLKKKTEWALKKGKKYARDIKLFSEMCLSCHRKYDYSEKSRKSLIKRTAGKPSPQRKIIIGVDSGGNKRKFRSITEASQIMRISKTAIINCLKGRSKKSGNISWSYEIPRSYTQSN